MISGTQEVEVSCEAGAAVGVVLVDTVCLSSRVASMRRKSMSMFTRNNRSIVGNLVASL